MLGDLFLPRDMPEAPKQGFFKNLFNINSAVLDREELCTLHRQITDIWGAIKKFSAWPSSVQNKIKVLFAFNSSKAQNTTCTM